MKRYPGLLVKYIFLCIVMALFLGACATSKYNCIEDTFNTANATQSIEKYNEVIAELNEDFIQDLDPKLQPKAYSMLAVSHNELKQFKEANAAADKGLNVNSRLNDKDKAPPGTRVLLKRMTGTIILDETVHTFNQREPNKKFTLKEYNGQTGEVKYSEDLGLAYAKFTEVWKDERGRENMPDSAIAGLLLERVRVLANWKTIVKEIEELKKERTENPTSQELPKTKIVMKGIQDKIIGDLQLNPEQDQGRCLLMVLRHFMCRNADGANKLDEALVQSEIKSSARGKRIPNLEDILDKKRVYKECKIDCYQ